MSDFLKTFLRERLGDEERPWEYFGLFGKHPGWNDHIEDLPLPTMSMALAKQLLYVQGIGSQISSGAWARLSEEVRLADFDHAFLWIRGRSFLAGRMWGSRDGKKRAHFPMVALVQGGSATRDAMLGSILAQLEQVASGCRAARSADEVREIVSRTSACESPVNPLTDGAPATFSAGRDKVVGIARDFRQKPSSCTRLPADPNDLPRSLRFWSRVCAALAPADVPLLFVAPLREPWVDLLINEPAPDKFFCLRACPPAVPVAHAATANDSVEELEADEIAKMAAGGRAPAGSNWISRLLGH